MDENTNIETTVAEEIDTSVSDEDLAAFDEAWDDDFEPNDNDDEIDLSDDENQPAADAPETVEETTEDNTEVDTSTEESHTEEEPHEDKPTEGHQLYKLKGIDGEKEYSFDDVLKLANKGLDYDGVRRDRDELREYKDFLKELADNSGISVDELVDSTRARIYRDTKKRNGEEVSETQALLAVQKARAEKKAESVKQAEETKKNDTSKMISAFVSEFRDVQAKDIPESVWKEAHETGDLAGAYRKYSNSQKDAEIARLKEENNKLKQNQKNKDRSIGSQRSAGNPTPKDPFDEGWDSV